MISRCSKCGEEAIYRQAYSGLYLCKECFLDHIESRVRKTLSKHKMLRYNDRVAIGISGGKDSLSLAFILRRIREDFPKSELIGITVDEGISRYREEAIDIAKRFCREIGIELIVGSFKKLFGYDLDEITRGEGVSPCSYCGVLRRKALNVMAREVRADRLATAHNLDDFVQTYLLNIVRGNMDRLAIFGPVTKVDHPKFVSRIKPLYEVPEREVSLYAYLGSIPFQQTPCPYRASSMRNDVRGFLNRLEGLHPGTKFTLLRSFQRIQERLPASYGEFKGCRVCGEPAVKDTCMACTLLSRIS